MVHLSKLNDLAVARSNIMQGIIASTALCKALYYATADFLEQPDLPDPDTLLYQYLFPYSFTPQEEDQRNYVTVQLKEFEVENQKLYSGSIQFNILIPVPLLQTKVGLRHEFIMTEIDKIIKQQRLGIGKAPLVKLDEIPMEHGYVGAILEYKIYHLL